MKELADYFRAATCLRDVAKAYLLKYPNGDLAHHFREALRQLDEANARLASIPR